MPMFNLAFAIVVLLSLSHQRCNSFQSDELLADEEEFGLEEGKQQHQPNYRHPESTVSGSSPTIAQANRRKYLDPESDSKIQFPLEHAFGNSEFSPAGTFSARLKTWNHGGQTLTKLRFSRNAFAETDKEKFENLLEEDEFYRIRLPSNVLSPSAKTYVMSSVKARCLPRDALAEYFVIHMEGANILAVNYGSSGPCPYPRHIKLPSDWSFVSRTVLKTTEQASRVPVFSADIDGENVGEEVVKPPERSFWAKYWMYIIPLGLIVMNAMTQAMNMPEEQAAGSRPDPHSSIAAPQRSSNSATLRRR